MSRDRKARAAGRDRDQGSTERIPTLTAFLDRIAGRVPLVIEIKSRFDGDLALTRRTPRSSRPLPASRAFKSFDPAIVAALRGRASSPARHRRRERL